MFDAFREITVVDFEFAALSGASSRSGRRFRIWQDQFGPRPPLCDGVGCSLCAFYASADLGFYRVLDWLMPERILDVYAEFRHRTNGLPTPAGWNLLGALTYFGLDSTGATEKKELQQAIGSDTWQGRFTPTEILGYCEGDLEALTRFCSPRCRRLTSLALCYADGTWQLPRLWNTVPQSIRIRWHVCVKAGLMRMTEKILALVTKLGERQLRRVSTANQQIEVRTSTGARCLWALALGRCRIRVVALV